MQITPTSKVWARCCRRIFFLSLPTNLSGASTPDETQYHYFCCNPSRDTATIAHHANTLICSLHPNKTDSSINPRAIAASRLIPLLTNISQLLAQLVLRAVFDQYGLTGLQKLLDNHLGCPLFTLSNAIAFPTKQGPFENPNLFMHFSSSILVSLVLSVCVLLSSEPFKFRRGEANIPNCRKPWKAVNMVDMERSKNVS